MRKVDVKNHFVEFNKMVGIDSVHVSKKVLSAARRCITPHEAHGLLSLTQDLPVLYTQGCLISSLPSMYVSVTIPDTRRTFII